ncbi:putative uncharacterized protein [Pseudomonas sp. StFLB209]|uniref:hypothetical protein n=1 Tax=Pseudomonas sp. StFLB209 TaxID=1028989 RepID=UPI0004F8678A|nr:hypothetical protein [Pseudomonas sp. StFLB209]BAP43910.1 putative uncharacterized protein [Pseudomonas sp. StFLB209]
MKTKNEVKQQGTSMIGIPETGTLKHSCVSANVNSGFQLTTIDGRQARLAVVDEYGNIVDVGDAVAKEVWNVSVKVYKNFQIGQGHIVVHSAPPGTPQQGQNK